MWTVLVVLPTPPFWFPTATRMPIRFVIGTSVYSREPAGPLARTPARGLPGAHSAGCRAIAQPASRSSAGTYVRLRGRRVAPSRVPVPPHTRPRERGGGTRMQVLDQIAH